MGQNILTPQDVFRIGQRANALFEALAQAEPMVKGGVMLPTEAEEFALALCVLGGRLNYLSHKILEQGPEDRKMLGRIVFKDAVGSAQMSDFMHVVHVAKTAGKGS